MSQLINETIEAFDMFSQGMLSEEDVSNGIQAGLISESLFDELAGTYLSELSSMSFEKAPVRKGLDVVLNGPSSALVHHFVDRSHHKEIAEKLKKAGVSSETLKKVDQLKAYADRNPSGEFKRGAQNFGRSFLKGNEVINPLAYIGHSIHKEHLKDIHEKLKKAGVSDKQLDKVHEFDKIRGKEDNRSLWEKIKEKKASIAGAAAGAATSIGATGALVHQMAVNPEFRSAILGH